MKKIKKILTKIGKFFSKIFSSCYKFFDTILITPISKVVYFITDKFSGKSISIERFLNKPHTLLYISLIFAFLVFLGVDKRVINLTQTEALVLSQQKVNVEYNEEAFVVEGVPSTVDIVLMGRKSDLYLAGQLGEHKVSLDLTSSGVGTHKVNLKYNNPINTLNYKLDPSSVTVVIYPKVSEVRTLTIDILNTDKLKDTLVVSNVKLSKNEVIIKSHQDKLNKVASVKALVDVNSINAKEAGSYSLENVKLVAYDENGTEIKGIEIVPGQISANITIASPSKSVPIKVVPVGEISTGSAIGTIETSISKVTIYGDEAILSQINFIEVEIDVSNLSANKTYQKAINKPSGIRAMSDTTITINVKIQNQISKDFEKINIEFEGLAPGLKAYGLSQNDTMITVTVKGVSSVIDGLELADIRAYVDLKGLKTGEHEIPVYVTGKDLKLTYTSKVQKVKIKIE
ncbi:MAG: CdaR family protein [Bacilli bacterium]